jgi:outer membrane autotransporter protein
MKKMVIMAALAIAAVSASAVEVGIRATHSAGVAGSALGVTLSQPVGPVDMEVAYDRSTRGAVNVDRWSAGVSYDLTKVGQMTLSTKVGLAHINPTGARNGTAMYVGVGAEYPLTQQLALTADYQYQFGQNRVRAFNGNRFMMGVKYTF